MDAWGWFINVGIRVVDLLLLGAWLFWFFRRMLDDDGEPEDDEPRDDGGNQPEPGAPSGGGGGDGVVPAPGWRLRDHGGRRGVGARRGRRVARPPARVTSRDA